MDPSLPPPPPGVTLRDPLDHKALRSGIEDHIKGAVKDFVHGTEYGKVRLEASNLRFEGKEDYSPAEKKEALLSDRSLSRKLKGTLTLVDRATNLPLDHLHNLTLASTPWISPEGTTVHGGNEQVMTMQARLLPGAYALKSENGETVLHMNTRPGTGPYMKVSMDPLTGTFRLHVRSVNAHAYSIFKDLGVSDDELRQRWGEPLWEINRKGYDPRALGRVYEKAVPIWKRTVDGNVVDKAKAVRKAFEDAQLSSRVMQDNLPNLYDAAKSASWRREGGLMDAIDPPGEWEKSAGVFAPDFSPQDLELDLISFDFEGAVEMAKIADFSPDLSPDELREAINALQAGAGPRMASMANWPDHWLIDTDPNGWLQWYQNYAAGRRTDGDATQIERWRSFKRRHGAQFISNPSPRRAWALRHWAIDPLKMLDPADRPAMQEKMEQHRRIEYVRWALSRHHMTDERMQQLIMKARARGCHIEDGAGPNRALMQAALEGFIQPEDL